MNIINTIEKHQNGIIGALMIHIILFVWLNLKNVSFVVIQPIEKTIATLDFTNDEIEEIFSDNVDLSTIDPVKIKQTASNFDIDNNTNQTSNFNSKQTDQEILEELKAFESKEFNKLSVDNPEIITIEEELTPNSENTKSVTPTGKLIEASAKYSLSKRSAIYETIPTFICNQVGIVRLDIKVNQKGNVVDCRINGTHTTTSNECLIKNASEYAKKWRFEQDFNQASKMNGWIEFVYLSQ